MRREHNELADRLVNEALDAERDHIDRWLEEIAEQLPMLDLRVEGIVDRINGIQRRIRRMLDETLEEHGLTSGEWHVLGRLSPARTDAARPASSQPKSSSRARR